MIGRSRTRNQFRQPVFKGKNSLLENNISGQEQGSSGQIIQFISFSAKRISKKNASLCSRIKFGFVSC